MCALILKRETLLKNIEAFEMVASNPSRLFFKKGEAKGESSRLEEAHKREALLRPLHSLEAKISMLSSRIKSDLREIVTFEGVPYVEKIKHDYIEIIKQCSHLRPKSS